MKIIKTLLSYKADPNILRGDNVSPLDLAIENNAIDIASLLISKGSKYHGKPILEYAIQNNNDKLVKSCLQTGDDPNILIEDTPILHISCFHKNFTIVKELIEHGSDVNQINSSSKYLPTALMISCSQGNTKITKYLLSKGANPNININEHTALKCCCDSQSFSCFKLVLEHGGSPNEIISENNTSILHYAVSKGQYKIVELLLNKGANLNSYTKCSYNEQNIKEDFYLTPLHLSCQKGFTKITKLLLQHGSDPYFCSYEEKNCIHFGCESGNIELVRTLLMIGMHINERTYSNKTGLDYCLENKHKKLFEYLQRIFPEFTKHYEKFLKTKVEPNLEKESTQNNIEQNINEPELQIKKESYKDNEIT